MERLILRGRSDHRRSTIDSFDRFGWFGSGRVQGGQGNLWIGRAVSVLMLVACLWLSGGQAAQAALPSGNAITDGAALLRYALPIDNPAARKFQSSLESTSPALRAKRWGAIASSIKTADRVLKYQSDDLLKSVAPDRQAEMAALIDRMKESTTAMLAAAEAKDRSTLLSLRRDLLADIGTLEASMVQGFPFAIPADYAHLPQLKGRATIELTTSQGPVTIVVDGYSAPVTAGNFVDLVQRGFYDGLSFTRAEDSYVLQFGDPPGKDEGFIDPATGQYRAIPLEVLAAGDKEPTYGITLEDAGRYGDLPVLPFSAYGALAMARPEPDPDGGSSQVFFFLFEPELTPAGANLLDGRYAVFGYTIEGQDVLGKLKPGDRIESARVVDGAEHLVQPVA